MTSMKYTKICLVALVVAAGAGTVSGADWIVDPSPFVAQAYEKDGRIVLENGLVRRELLLKPDVTTWSFKCLTTGEEYVRAPDREAQFEVDGKWYDVGGVKEPPVLNYTCVEWEKSLQPLSPSKGTSGVYHYAGHAFGPIRARFEWQRHPEWSARELPWPPKGRELTLSFTAPAANLPKVEVHYEIYDGAPIISKWVRIENTSTRTNVVKTCRSDLLRLAESHGNSDIDHMDRPNDLFFLTELFFADASSTGRELGGAYQPDSAFLTQENYARTRACRYVVEPCGNFATYLAPGQAMESIRAWEIAMDSTERERRGLAIRRFWRLLAPWTDENPLIFHLKSSGDAQVRAGIEQCKATGFETLLMSFGSGFNLESADPAYRARYAKLSAEAKAAGIALGGYSLTSSRSAATVADNVLGPCRYGKAPCLGAQWGVDYLKGLKDFMKGADFGIFENDGPYPGDICSSTTHPYHHGAADSFRVQWEAQRDLYRFCRANGIYVNQPDSYYLNGGNKNGMGYRETNWSLPRELQVLIERQNVFDGTWTKTSSMGWMFVPLTVYHGGGAAAVVEPLKENLKHYDQRFADLLGAGVQACWRGPRLYDSPETLAVVKKWVDFYKTNRRILTGDFIHLRRADGRDWDGWMMCDAQNPGPEKAIAFFFNPTSKDITRTIALPLHYAGLADRTITVTIPAKGYKHVKLSMDNVK